MEEREQDRKSSYPPIEFIYDEEDEYSLENQLQEELDDIRHYNFDNLHIGTVLLGVLGLILGLCIGLFINWNRGRIDETNNSNTTNQTTEEKGNESETVTAQEEYWQRMWQYFQDAKVTVEQDFGSGAYALETYIISDLDGDGSYPEAFGVMWNEKLGRYMLEMYSFAANGAGEIVFQADTLDELETIDGVIEGLLLNHVEEKNEVDIILTGRKREGGFFSAFFQFIGKCTSRGIVEGIPQLQEQRLENGQVRSSYDINGVYQIAKEFSTVSGVKAVQDWTVDSRSGLKLDTDMVQEAVAEDYWRLEGMPIWYLKRPILVYEADIQFNSLNTLDSEYIKVTGVLERDGEYYYQIIAESGEIGWILLSGIERGNYCQVKLQNLPFLEVFSETKTEERTESLTEPLGKVIIGSGEIILEEAQSGCEVWCDLNGDGIWERLSATWEALSYDNNYGTLYIMINDETVATGEACYKTENLSVVIIDLNRADSWVEFGYGYKASTELYRYDGTSVRSLGLDDALRWEGKVQWFSLDTDGAMWGNGKAVVYNRQYNELSEPHSYEYDIKYDTITGNFIREDMIECRLESPVQGIVSESQPLYESTETDEIVDMLKSGDIVIFDSLYICWINDNAYFRGHFICENGVSGYSGQMHMEELNTYFRLYDFFGYLAG